MTSKEFGLLNNNRRYQTGIIDQMAVIVDEQGRPNKHFSPIHITCISAECSTLDRYTTNVTIEGWAEDCFLRVEQPKPPIKKVIFNPPATIVLWSDGSKTVVKCKDEPFDKEKGLAMAISRKALGNRYDYYNVFKKYLKEKKK